MPVSYVRRIEQAVGCAVIVAATVATAMASGQACAPCAPFACSRATGPMTRTVAWVRTRETTELTPSSAGGFLALSLAGQQHRAKPGRGSRRAAPVNGRIRVAMNLRRVRREQELTQEDVAELAGIHRTYVGSVERAERNVSVDNICRLAQALGVDPQELLRS